MLHLFCGKIASGKSTLAREIAAQENGILLVQDEWMATLFPGEIKTIEDFASALGKLSVTQATGPLLTLLCSAEQESVRMELTLALARILNSEASFVQLWRATRREPGLALAQELSNLQKLFEKRGTLPPIANSFFVQSIEAFAHENVAQGALSLSYLLADLSLIESVPAIRQIRRECLTQLSHPESLRFEYILLASQLLRNASMMTE